jgi:hypothetical protein
VDTNACSLSCSHESPTDIFIKLMGDVVEPRREFIQDNVLTASVDVSGPHSLVGPYFGLWKPID